MHITTLFREFHQGHPLGNIAFFDTLDDAHWRTRPHPAVNSLAWLIWHMARVEDAGVNRLVVNLRQFMDEGNWGERMQVPIRHHGTGMTTQEVTDLSNRIDLPSLRAYHTAVRARTLEVLDTLRPEMLDQINELPYLRQVQYDEGVLNPNYDWGGDVIYKESKGHLLMHFGVTHNYGHFCEANVVCSLMGTSPG
ncbi:MAG: DinB family protein [Chloroflexota bacterium]|nr:DinB family protein [Chloroflexota bacterium]